MSWFGLANIFGGDDETPPVTVDKLEEMKSDLLSLILLDIIPFDVLEKMGGKRISIKHVGGFNAIEEAKKFSREEGMQDEIRKWLEDEPNAKDTLLEVVHQRLYLGWRAETKDIKK